MTAPMMPPIAVGAPARAPDWRTEIRTMQHQLDVLTRKGEPLAPLAFCRVHLTVDVSTPPNSDLYAYGNWVANSGDDPDGLFTPGGANPSTITIANSGRYTVQHRTVCTQTGTSNSVVAFITKNAAAANNSIARDRRDVSTTNGSDGATADAVTTGIWLNAGDVLYWGIWTFAAMLMKANNIGVSTFVVVEQTGYR